MDKEKVDVPKMIGVRFPKDEASYDKEIRDRASKLHMSSGKYIRMIMINHIKSGDAVTLNETDK